MTRSLFYITLFCGASASAGTDSHAAIDKGARPKAELSHRSPHVKRLSANEAATLFNDSLSSFHQEKYSLAAAKFYTFLAGVAPGTENYGWAQYFLAQSLEALGYPYAAQVYYYLVAKTRSQPEIISDALEHLQKLARAEGTMDEELLYDDLLYGNEFGPLPTRIASWISLSQGITDYRHSFIDWGERRFKSIDGNTRFSLDANYVRAVWAVKEHHDVEAMDLLHSIQQSPIDAPRTKNQAKLASARLLFEKQRYSDAIAMYDRVEQIDLSYEQAQILTEKAWASYYTKDFARALGDLHALHAPSYQQFFFPEMFLLRALILKDLCHYLDAKNIIRTFRLEYGRTLEQIKQRFPLEKIDRIRRAAAREGSIARRTALLQEMRRESLEVNEQADWAGSSLQAGLLRLLEDSTQAHDRRWRIAFGRESDAVALRLLDTAEQLRMLDYEISLAIFKPLDEHNVSLDPEKVADLPKRSTHDYYQFDGEYWNEELLDYQYYISNRCFGQDG